MRLLSYLKIIVLLLSLIFASFEIAYAGKDSRPQKNVLLLVSYDVVHPWSETFVNAVMQQSKNLPYNIRFDVLELNTMRSPDENEYQKRLESRLFNISNNKYDAIITLDDPALDLLLQNKNKLNLSAPVVFAGYEKDSSSLRQKYKNLTGVRQISDVEKTIQQGIKFYPKTRRILVVCDSSKSSQVFEENISKLKINGVKIETVNTTDKTIFEISNMISTLDGNTLVLVCPWRGIRENDYQSTPAFGMDIGRLSKKPYLIADISMLGFGALGGWVTDPVEHGKHTVWLLEKTLDKKSATDIRIMATKARPFFDWNVMNQFDLESEKLPAYSFLKNRPIGYWEHYKTQIISFIIAFIALGGALFSHMYTSLRTSKKTMELIESFPGRIGVFDEEGNILYLSSENASEVRLAKHLKELPNLNYDLFSAEAKKTFENGQRRTYEYDTNGEHRFVIISPLSESLFGKPTAMWFSTDNTELFTARKNAEKAELEKFESQQKYIQAMRLWDIVINTLPTMFFAKDADDNFRYLLCNDAFAEFVGKERKDIIGKTDLEIFGDEKLAMPFVEKDRFAIESDNGLEFEEFCLDSNGMQRCYKTIKVPYTDAGKRMLIGVSTDITELNALYKMQKAMTACMEFIFAKDDPQGSISFALKTLGEQTDASRCVIFKLEDDHKYLHSHSEFVANGREKIFDRIELPEDEIYTEDNKVWTAYEDLSEQAKSFGSKWETLIKENKISAMYVNRISIKEKFWGYIVLFYENEIPDESRKQTMRPFSRFIEVIIEREFSQMQILSALEQAREANRAKSYFIASVSHEIRTPLNTVIGLSELLRNSTVSEEEQKQYLESIVYGGNALLQLINDVLDLSKLEAGQMNIVSEFCNLLEIADGVRRLFQHKASEKNIELQIDIPIDMPMLLFDRMRIRQILLNLLGNAVKFTSKGFIKIWAKFEKIDEQFCTLTFAVSDTGTGIAQEDIANLMNPFVQLGNGRGNDDFNRGTGLGLPISKRLAEKMGGELWIKSRLGEGSTFGVTINSIRYSPKKQTTAIPESSVVASGVDKNISLLIVDDVDMNRKVLKAMCAKMGVVDIETASSAKEALAILQTRKFSLVLTDIWMPEMSGEDFAREIRKVRNYDDIPIVAVTADIEARGNFDVNVFSGILLKPITIAKINKIIAYAQNPTQANLVNELEK